MIFLEALPEPEENFTEEENRKVSTLFRKYENNVQVPVALAFTTPDMWVGTFQ